MLQDVNSKLLSWQWNIVEAEDIRRLSWKEGVRRQVIDFLTDRVIHFDGCNWVREVTWWKRKFEEVQFGQISRDEHKVADKAS